MRERERGTEGIDWREEKIIIINLAGHDGVQNAYGHENPVRAVVQTIESMKGIRIWCGENKSAVHTYNNSIPFLSYGVYNNNVL